MVDEAVMRMLRALSDDNRIAIVEMLLNGETCACKILEKLNITQPTLSHHMRILVNSGLVNARKDGQWTRYSLDSDSMNTLSEYVNGLSSRCCTNGESNCMRK